MFKILFYYLGNQPLGVISTQKQNESLLNSQRKEDLLQIESLISDEKGREFWNTKFGAVSFLFYLYFKIN